MAMQKKHHIPDLTLSRPGFGYHGDAFLTDTRHFQQPLDLVVNDIQGLFAEFVDDAAGHHRTQAFDHARAQVFANTVNGRRYLGPVLEHLKLPAESGMVCPLAAHIKDLTGHGGHQGSHHRHRFVTTGNFDPGDGKAVFFVGEGDALDLTGKGGWHGYGLIGSL